MDYLKCIGVLIATVDTGSLTKAGKLQGITPQGAMNTVRRLEDKIGVPLFETTTRSVVPTKECLAIYDEVKDSYNKFIFDLHSVIGEDI